MNLNKSSEIDIRFPETDEHAPTQSINSLSNSMIQFNFEAPFKQPKTSRSKKATTHTPVIIKGKSKL